MKGKRYGSASCTIVPMMFTLPHEFDAISSSVNASAYAPKFGLQYSLLFVWLFRSKI